MGQGEPPFPVHIEDTIVKEIKEGLRAIGRYCPNDLVKNAREKESKVKNSNNKELPNEFIQLDKEMKIDAEDENIKKFSETILKFVENIAHFFEKLSGLRFEINSAGSFPLGNKIEAIDEFDFVLEWINMPKELTELGFWQMQNLDYNRRSDRNYPGMITRCLFEKLLLEIQDVEKVTVTTLIQKKFATNLVILWECSYCHKHEVSLDLAFSVKLKDTMQKYFAMMSMNFKNTPFEKIMESREFTYFCFPFVHQRQLCNPFQESRVDTNYYDKCLFAVCDKISPNIKLSFRITKFICSKVFPRECKNHNCMSQKMTVCEFEPFISSYVLKQLLFREVLDFPSSKDWSVDFIQKRVTSLFKRLLKVSEIQDFLNPIEEKDIRVEPKNLQFECFDTYVNKLISWFQNRSTEKSEDLIASKVADGSRQLWFLRKVLIITAKETKPFWPQDPALCPIFKLDITGTRFEAGNTKNIFYDMYNEIISDTIYVDLTAHNELYFRLFVVLYSADCGVLEEEDVQSDKVIEKLNIIREITEMFETTFETVCSTLIKLNGWLSCNYDHVFKVSSFFAQITMKEAALIYKYLEQQASRNEETVYNVNESNVDSMLTEAVFKNTPHLSQRPKNTDFDGKDILMEVENFYIEEVVGYSPINKARLWLYSIIMKNLGKI